MSARSQFQTRPAYRLSGTGLSPVIAPSASALSVAQSGGATGTFGLPTFSAVASIVDDTTALVTGFLSSFASSVNIDGNTLAITVTLPTDVLEGYGSTAVLGCGVATLSAGAAAVPCIVTVTDAAGSTTLKFSKADGTAFGAGAVKVGACVVQWVTN